MQPHIIAKKGDVEEAVILPGDPGRIKVINSLCEKSEKISENREFVLYRSFYKGRPLSILSTGIGCPSAAIAFEEAALCGGKYFIRIGTCGALKKDIKAGNFIIPYAAMRKEGTSGEYVEQSYPAVADFKVFELLTNNAIKENATFFTGVNRTHDGFYESMHNFDRLKEIFDNYPNNDLVSSEMECSIIFLLAQLKGLKAGAILTVNTEEPLDDQEKAQAEDVYHLSGGAEINKSIKLSAKIALETVVKLTKKS